MPWPCCRPVSATCARQVVGSAQPVEKERKLTTIAGCGVTALPLSRAPTGQRARELADVVDEEAADVVLLPQDLDERGGELALSRRGYR